MRQLNDAVRGARYHVELVQVWHLPERYGSMAPPHVYVQALQGGAHLCWERAGCAGRARMRRPRTPGPRPSAMTAPLEICAESAPPCPKLQVPASKHSSLMTERQLGNINVFQCNFIRYTLPAFCAWAPRHPPPRLAPPPRPRRLGPPISPMAAACSARRLRVGHMPSRDRCTTTSEPVPIQSFQGPRKTGAMPRGTPASSYGERRVVSCRPAQSASSVRADPSQDELRAKQVGATLLR